MDAGTLYTDVQPPVFLAELRLLRTYIAIQTVLRCDCRRHYALLIRINRLARAKLTLTLITFHRMQLAANGLVPWVSSDGKKLHLANYSKI